MHSVPITSVSSLRPKGRLSLTRSTVGCAGATARVAMSVATRHHATGAGAVQEVRARHGRAIARAPGGAEAYAEKISPLTVRRSPV